MKWKIRNCAVRNIRRPGAVRKRIIMVTAIPTAMGMAGEEHCCHEGQDHHEHHHEPDKIPSVSVYTHEIATVGSVKCRIPGTYEKALEKLKDCMKKTAEAVEEAEGLIGHVKAFAREEARTCMISITDGEDMQCRPGSGQGIYVESANIVFGVTPEELEAILKRTFAEFLQDR